MCSCRCSLFTFYRACYPNYFYFQCSMFPKNINLFPFSPEMKAFVPLFLATISVMSIHKIEQLRERMGEETNQLPSCIKHYRPLHFVNPRKYVTLSLNFSIYALYICSTCKGNSYFAVCPLTKGNCTRSKIIHQLCCTFRLHNCTALSKSRKRFTSGAL